MQEARCETKNQVVPKVVAVLLILTLLLLLTFVALAQGGYDLSWRAIAGGSGRMTSARYTLMGTVGQPLAGATVSSGRALCSGFWCGVVAEYHIYLPMVIRN